MKKYERIEKMLPSGHGHWRIWVRHYGKTISAVTNNMPTFDEFRSKERGWKKAGSILYNEVVRKNKTTL
jgi:hypothetical protein